MIANAAAVQASLPHGQVTVNVVKGGLDVPEDDRDDLAVIASAAVVSRITPGSASLPALFCD